jgi:hypothetical protein
MGFTCFVTNNPIISLLLLRQHEASKALQMPLCFLLAIYWSCFADALAFGNVRSRTGEQLPMPMDDVFLKIKISKLFWREEGFMQNVLVLHSSNVLSMKKQQKEKIIALFCSKQNDDNRLAFDLLRLFDSITFVNFVKDHKNVGNLSREQRLFLIN